MFRIWTLPAPALRVLASGIRNPLEDLSDGDGRDGIGAMSESWTTRAQVEAAGKIDRQYVVDLVDTAGEVCATCEKVITVKLRADRPRRREKER